MRPSLEDSGHTITVDWTYELGLSEADRDLYPERVEAIAVREQSHMPTTRIDASMFSPAMMLLAVTNETPGGG